MRLERTVEYHTELNVFRVFGGGLHRECVEVAGTQANLLMPHTIPSAARAIGGRVGDVRRGDFVECAFVHVDEEVES